MFRQRKQDPINPKVEINTQEEVVPTQVLKPLIPVIDIQEAGVQALEAPTPAPVNEYEGFLLSFYDPNIGRWFPDVAKINCANWDSVNNLCVSNLANGQAFDDWYGRGLACPPNYALGSVFNVVYPGELVGEWVCVDRGMAVDGRYLDFLLRYPDDIWTGYDLNNFPWSSPVVAYIRN